MDIVNNSNDSKKLQDTYETNGRELKQRLVCTVNHYSGEDGDGGLKETSGKSGKSKHEEGDYPNHVKYARDFKRNKGTEGKGSGRSRRTG